MKKRRIGAALLIASMSVFLFSGCSVRETVRKLDAAEERAERRLDAVEDAAEDAVEATIRPAQPAEKPSPAAEKTVTSNTETLLTPEEVQAIVLNHAGFTADQVDWLYTEFEIDDRVPQYEVQFRQGRLEYEYEVHGDTGEILSVDVDD